MQENLAPRRTYGRDSVEFARTLTFTDGLFAIAMTLLVVDLAVPTLSDGSSVHELAEALNDDSAKFISFFISFAVIGRYWVAHHTYFSALARMDRGLIALNLVYLAFIAFLPFPTALLGEYFENPLSIAIYAVNVAIVSSMEVVLFSHAQSHDLLERECRATSTATACHVPLASRLLPALDPGCIPLHHGGRVHVVPRDPLRDDRRSLEAQGGRRAADRLKPWASKPRDYRHSQ